MGDRSHAYIDIVGNLARDRMGELVKLLTDTFDFPLNAKSFEDLILEASSEGLILTFEEDNGEFGHVGIEKQLVDLGLAYDLRYESGSRYAEGEERYRPGMPEPRGFATHGGEVVVPSGIARALIEMISHGKLAEAMTLLGVSVGDDVPKLLPLRIV
jgi:hypothetical protein